MSQFRNSDKYRKYPLIEKKKIAQISETVFEVESQANTEITYRVDMFADTCSCPMQGICKQKKSIAHNFEIEQFAVLPSNDAFAMCQWSSMTILTMFTMHYEVREKIQGDRNIICKKIFH